MESLCFLSPHVEVKSPCGPFPGPTEGSTRAPAVSEAARRLAEIPGRQKKRKRRRPIARRRLRKPSGRARKRPGRFEKTRGHRQNGSDTAPACWGQCQNASDAASGTRDSVKTLPTLPLSAGDSVKTLPTLPPGAGDSVRTGLEASARAPELPPGLFYPSTGRPSRQSGAGAPWGPREAPLAGAGT
jgi:hypothetical protein